LGFYCKELQLAIEIDGDLHGYQEIRINDEQRQCRLESLAVSFLRFDDLGVKTNISDVIEEIQDWIEQNQPTNS